MRKPFLLFIFAAMLVLTGSNAQKVYPQDELAKVAPEGTMQTIIDRYKGKAVVVDMWETWCRPCLVGHKEMAPFKDKLKRRKIVFVYLSSPSSPYENWLKAVEGIPGEHYYLTEDQFAYISDKCGAKGAVPAYLFYNAKGKGTGALVGWDGVKRVKKKIREALKNY